MKENTKAKAVPPTANQQLLTECQHLLNYALKEGIAVDQSKVQLLTDDKLSSTSTAEQLLIVYNYLLDLVKPMKPRVIISMEKSEQSPWMIRMLGPLPIIRQFTILALLSMVIMIGVSLSPAINVHTHADHQNPPPKDHNAYLGTAHARGNSSPE